MVAEGPAVKMFDRLQHEMLGDDIELLWRVLRHAVEAGRLPTEALVAVDIRGIPPTLAVRDRLKDAQADQILVRNGAMSVADDGHAQRAGSGAGAAVDPAAGEPWLRAAPNPLGRQPAWRGLYRDPPNVVVSATACPPVVARDLPE